MECIKTETHQPIVGTSNLQIIKKYYKDSLKCINEGLNLEDSGKIKEAVLCYREGLKILDGALKLPNGLVGLSDGEANEYQTILAKLLRAQKEVYIRLDALDDDTVCEPSAPPLPNGISLQDNTDGSKQENKTWQDVKELISIEEGVRLFHVDEDNQVSTWSAPCKLNVFQILKENFDKVSPAAFMKCGDWIYPMEPGQSPVLQTQRRTYMFPDLSMQSSESSKLPCVGMVLTDFVPDGVVARFERILSCYCNFKKEVEKKAKEKPKRPPPPIRKMSEADQERKPIGKENSVVETDVIIAEPGVAEMEMIIDRPWSDKISAGIHVGSQWISWGLVRGAQYTSVLVGKGAATLRGKLTPNEEATVVDPQVSHNIRQLHQATGSIVQVSSILVNALGQLTLSLGNRLAPHVFNHGQQLLPEKYKINGNEKNQKTFDEAKKVAAAGLEGFALMFLSLEQAGKDLYNSIKDATVETVSFKYGDEAGDVTHNAMGAAGNTVQAYWNVKKLGPKALAKRAVKDTGKAMIAPNQEHMSDDKNNR